MYLSNIIVEIKGFKTNFYSRSSNSFIKIITLIYLFLTLIISIKSFARSDGSNSTTVIKDIKENSSRGLVFNHNQGQDENKELALQGDSYKTFGKKLKNNDILSILAVGDVLLHKPLQVQSYSHSERHKSLWKKMESLFQSVDMAYANLEGPIAPGFMKSGKQTKDPGPRFDDVVYTSYPMFNYHETLAEDLKESGIDVVSTANNHSLDRHSEGVNRTISILEKYELAYTGTISTEEGHQSQWYTIVERNQFRIAWIACTFSTNGIVDRLNQVLNCFNDQKNIKQMIFDLSNRSDVDGVIVTPHVGTEYEDQPRIEAVNLFRSFINAGAISIIGAHPHVLQPWEKYVSKDGREGFIIYSLGNFVSGQFHKLKTRATVLLNLNLTKNSQGKAIVHSVKYIPVEMKKDKGLYHLDFVDSNYGNQKIYSHIVKMFGERNLLKFPNALPINLNKP